MKKIILFILLALFAAPYSMQAQELQQKQKFYENKVIKFTKMKHAGVGLTICGTVLTVAGIGLMADGAIKNENLEYDMYSPEYNEGSAEILLGLCSSVIGISAISGGVVLWVIGSSKANKYNHLRSFSFNLDPAPNQIFTLAYRF